MSRERITPACFPTSRHQNLPALPKNGSIELHASILKLPVTEPRRGTDKTLGSFGTPEAFRDSRGHTMHAIAASKKQRTFFLYFFSGSRMRNAHAPLPGGGPFHISLGDSDHAVESEYESDCGDADRVSRHSRQNQQTGRRGQARPQDAFLPLSANHGHDLRHPTSSGDARARAVEERGKGRLMVANLNFKQPRPSLATSAGSSAAESVNDDRCRPSSETTPRERAARRTVGGRHI